MTIVIDSSVWIAGIASSTGFANDVILLSHKSSGIEIFISDRILDEVTKNLIGKLKFTENMAFEARETVKNICDYEISIGMEDINNIKNVETKDRHILALCKKVQADYLITFDRKHLLLLDKFGKTKIIEPKDFVGRI